MNTVTYEKYMNDLVKFVGKHSKKNDFRVETSPMINDRYDKKYLFEDGSTFWEINEIITEEVEVEVHVITCKAQVELYRHEYWSTDDSSTKYWYESLDR